MSKEFDIFKGLVTGGFTFRGVDTSGGATFEHTCGCVIRIWPGAHISLIALEVSTHRCDEGEAVRGKVIVHRDFPGEHGGADCWCRPVVTDADSPRESSDVAREADSIDD